jgi:DNA-binding MarR family transcriptional regulator/GNAT superfamily N-acetyltransferase
MASDPRDISAFRRFNRFYTRLIGTLAEGFLSTDYSLAEGRVIYEIATRNTPGISEIAESLGMDPGYLSRILARFQKAGLIRRKVAPEDNRRANLTLTPKGQSAFQTLDSLSNQQAHTILDALPDTDRDLLIGSMKTIEDILSSAGKDQSTCILRPHRPGDMGWIVCREAAIYTQEQGWDGTFEALVARIVADFIATFDPAKERCWIAEIGGRHAGHIFLVRDPDHPDTAKLRLLLVEPAARGRGLGHVLVNECIRFARATGYRKVTLWTQSVLTAAHKIYQESGFRLVKEEPHRSFGKDLIGQTWELDLAAESA